MDFRIFYYLLWILAARSVETCAVSYDEQLCTFIETCDCNTHTYQEWEMFIYHFNHEYGTNNKRCLNPIYYGGNYLYPVYLALKGLNCLIYEINNNMQIPRVNNDNDENIIHRIYSLDLSGTGFSQMPVITRMNSLVRLDMSNNNLNSAVLSNANDLRVLTEIILSNNLINKIEINEREHIYTNLKILNLSHNLITNLPDGIFEIFVNLTKLDLSFNNIDRLSLTTFENIKMMVDLDLSFNRLTDINSSLFRFSGLNILNLSGNTIKDIKRSDFEHLRNLKTLDLSSNVIKYINSDVFSTMVSLENLYLNNNHLEVLDKNTFVHLQSLNKIDLAKNKLKSLPKNLFNSTMISYFSIEDNILEGALEKGLFEGINVTQLDISKQLLTEVKDQAFYDLTQLNVLLLNDNNIMSLSKWCFESLINLKQLDLSNNQITNIDFNKEDLKNLRSLLLKNNNLTEINHEHLEHLRSLNFLDLSDNHITRFVPTSFQSLLNLVNLAINNNLLLGTVETGTFDGLVSLPSLDISRNMLTTLQNASFIHMIKLKELNMSHCDITELQYNTFDHTGDIEILDISHNKLDCFFVNTTHIIKVTMLLLNNNLIKSISWHSLHGLSHLNNIILSRNVIENIHNESFNSLVNLRYLDLSDNEKLHLPVAILENNTHLNTLILSGVRVQSNFSFVLVDNLISDLRLANINARNICELSLGKMANVNFLDLNFNNISKLQMGDLNGIIALSVLDLSFNQITSIQPGVFKDNTELKFLNISHNYISTVGYGIFRGLIHLTVLDMSYNKIKDLQTERFYEAVSLSELIVDHNKIDVINTEEFAGTRLSKLSIGNNPLSCQALVKLKKQYMPFVITAIDTEEHSNENVNGITCNKDTILGSIPNPENGVDNNVLNSLQHTLSILTNTHIEQKDIGNSYLEKITNALEKSNTAYNEKLSNLVNLTSEVIMASNKTNVMFSENNMMLNKIINFLNKTVAIKSSTPQTYRVTAPSINTSAMANNSSSSQIAEVMIYINNIKKEIENSIAIDKQNINRIESKLAINNHGTESLPPNVDRQQLVNNNESTKSYFTDTCVALILFILVGLIFYKFYKSKILQRNRFSSSSRELPEAMENSSL